MIASNSTMAARGSACLDRRGEAEVAPKSFERSGGGANCRSRGLGMSAFEKRRRSTAWRRWARSGHLTDVLEVGAYGGLWNLPGRPAPRHRQSAALGRVLPGPGGLSYSQELVPGQTFDARAPCQPDDAELVEAEIEALGVLCLPGASAQRRAGIGPVARVSRRRSKFGRRDDR
jgi:hypothetical protein